jgi:hypothetical protein
MNKKSHHKASNVKVKAVAALHERTVESIALIRRAEQPTHTSEEFIKARHTAFRTLSEEVQMVAVMSPNFTIKSQALLNFNISPAVIKLVLQGPKKADAEVQHLLESLGKLGIEYNFKMSQEPVDVRILVDRASRYHDWLRSEEGKDYAHQSRERHQKAEQEWHAHLMAGGASAHLDTSFLRQEPEATMPMADSLKRLPGQLLRPTAPA